MAALFDTRRLSDYIDPMLPAANQRIAPAPALVLLAGLYLAGTVGALGCSTACIGAMTPASAPADQGSHHHDAGAPAPPAEPGSPAPSDGCAGHAEPVTTQAARKAALPECTWTQAAFHAGLVMAPGVQFAAPMGEGRAEAPPLPALPPLIPLRI
jgi:hypothetical protein